MTSDEWQTIESLFEEALDQPEAEREAWVRERCQDAGIRREVLGLLAAAATEDGFLDNPARVFASDLIASAERAEHPAQIGPYRPIRELGRGGMGAVFLAERSDGQFEHRVALKMLGRRFPSDDLRQRFLAERQILATLNHPGIARLLDGGVTGEGTLYFAMEYVDGRPIDQYCAEERVPLRERLQLFLQACEAVTYAHRNLVVHRDLKPSNILVEEDRADRRAARVKLLDFGIAKLLGPDGEPSASPVTVTGMNVMTPEYASPEQVAGGPVTTVSDVYQLGVLLHGLLTGRRLYDFSGRSITEIAHVVGSVEAPRPSSLADGFPAAAEQLKGDLDAIVGKALRKEPEARYESVDRLSDDIRRYLERRPVIAHTGSFAYRTRKLVRRHRWAALGALVFAVAVAGYVVSITALQARTEQERDRAEQYAAFLTDVFSSPDPFTEEPGDQEVTVREFFDQAVERVRTEFDHDPEMQVSLLGTIAEVYSGLNHDEQALALYRDVLDIGTRLHGPRSEPVVEALRGIAWRTGNPAAADSLYRLQLDIAREIEGRTGPLTAKSLVPYGSFLSGQDRLEDAERMLEEAVEVFRDEGPELERDLVGALFFLGQTRRMLGKLALADTALREAYGLRAEQYGPTHVRTAILMTELGMVAEGLGDLEEATEWKQGALDVFSATLGDGHPYTLTAMNNVAILLDTQGRVGEAEQIIRRVYEAREALYGADHRETVGSLQNLGAFVLRQGRPDEAEPILEEVRARYARSLPEGHHLRAYPLLSLTELRLRRGDHTGAEAVAREAVSILRSGLSDEHPLTAIAESRLGETLVAQRRLAEAEPLLLDGYRKLRSISGFAERRQSAIRRLADLYDAWERPAEADRYRALLEEEPGVVEPR
jgi:serine/threonine-protein kinase